MDFYDYYNPDVLAHYGILGMKWGVRRYQNKDGSLTVAGGKRYNGSDYQPRKSLSERYQDYKKATQRKKSLEKARAAKEAKKKAEEEAKVTAEQRKKDIAAGKIKTKDMTDEEIKWRTERLANEKRLKQLQDETASPLETMASQMVNKAWKEAILPAATEAGKQILKDSIMKAANGNEKVEEFDLEKTWKNINKLTTQQVMDVNKRLTAQEGIKQKIDKIHETQKAEQDAKNKDKADAEAKKQAMKDYNAYQKQERESRENPSSSTTEKTTYNTRDNKTEYHNRRDYVDPSKEPKAENPPAVVNSSVSSKSMNSAEVIDASERGKNIVSQVLDRDGNIIADYYDDDK